MALATKKKTRLAATGYNAAGLSKLISRAFRNHERQVEIIDSNRLHFFKDPSVDPQLLPPYEDITYQSDNVRKAHVELKARASENHYVFSMRAMDGKSTSARQCEAIAEALNTAALLREETLGYEIQDALFDGQSIAPGYGVLHWRRADTGYPKIPDYEFCDELPEDGADEYREVETEDEEKTEAARGKKYMRTEDSIGKELRGKRSRAGFPYQWEVLDPRSVKFLPDSISDVGIVCHIRTLRIHDYKDELKGDGLHIDLTHDLNLRIYESEVPADDDPAAITQEFEQDNITVATVWTRDSWYELATTSNSYAAGQDGGWELVKSGKHGFGRPPFALASGDTFNHPDVARRYVPYLQGALDLKPRHDFTMALGIALTMSTAQKLKFITRSDKAGPDLTEDGKDLLDLTTDSSQARELPPGSDIKVIDDDISQGFVLEQRMIHELYKDALPPVPSSEISASTQPWTARTIVQQLSVVIKRAIKAQAICIQIMARSILRDIGTPAEDGGFGTIAYVMRPGKDGEEDEIIAIDPLKMPVMEISVAINNVTSSERTVTVEHGKMLMQEGVIHPKDFYDNYYSVPNSDKYMQDLAGWQLFSKQLLPGLMAQKVGRKFGAMFVIGPDGQFLNMQGAATPPGNIAEANGIQKLNPANMGSYGTQGGMATENMTTMPRLTDQSRPPGVPQQQAMA